MTRCSDVHATLSEGRSLDSQERTHIEGCGACRALAAEGGALGRTLAHAREGERSAEPEALAGVLERLEAAVARERGPGAWLRSRPTPVRLAIMLSAVAVIAAGSYLALGRSMLHDYPVDRLALVMGTLAAVLVAAAALGLRPLYRISVPRWRTWAVGLAAVGLPMGFAVWPHTSGAGPLAVHELGAGAARCFAMGSLLAGAVLALWQVLRRTRASGARSVLGAAAAALAGNVALQCQCPATEPLHLMWGHAGVAAVFLLGAALWTAAANRRTA